MHINTSREKRRKEMSCRDTYVQSEYRYGIECGECKIISMSEADKISMLKRAKKGVVILSGASFLH